MKLKKDLLIGCLFAILAALGFSLMNTLAKYATYHAPVPFVVFFRFLFGFLLLIPLFLKDKTLFIIQRPWLYLLRGCLSCATLFLLVIAVKYIPVANVVLLSITYPFFLPLIAKFFFKRKIPMMIFIGISIGFFGVILVLEPSQRNFALFPSLLALITGILTAISFITIRMLSKSESKTKILFYYYLISLLVSLIPALIYWEAITFTLLIVTFLMGITGNLFQYCISSALQKAHSVIVSPLMFLAIFFSMISDWLIWKEVPTFPMVLGSFFILGGLVITVIINNKHHHLLQ